MPELVATHLKVEAGLDLSGAIVRGEKRSHSPSAVAARSSRPLTRAPASGTDRRLPALGPRTYDQRGGG